MVLTASAAFATLFNALLNNCLLPMNVFLNHPLGSCLFGSTSFENSLNNSISLKIESANFES